VSDQDLTILTKFGLVVKKQGGTDNKKSAPSVLVNNSILPNRFFKGENPTAADLQKENKMTNLLIKEIVISKNMKSGDWEVKSIDTNHGKFGTGPNQTEKIDQQLVREIVKHLKEAFQQDVEEFIEGEENGR